MSESHNPYAEALDGLVLDDPVAAFFDFCREREQIRSLRESGAPAPWTDDPILQRGRFLRIPRRRPWQQSNPTFCEALGGQPARLNSCTLLRTLVQPTNHPGCAITQHPGRTRAVASDPRDPTKSTLVQCYGLPRGTGVLGRCVLFTIRCSHHTIRENHGLTDPDHHRG